MTTISCADYRRDEQASRTRRTLYAATNTNGEWCEVTAESTSRLMAIAALALAAIRPTRKEDSHA